jgi:hypothetical protein
MKETYNNMKKDDFLFLIVVALTIILALIYN